MATESNAENKVFRFGGMDLDEAFAYKAALEKILDIANTPGEDAAIIKRGMTDVAFDALSRYEYRHSL